VSIGCANQHLEFIYQFNYCAFYSRGNVDFVHEVTDDNTLPLTA